MENEKPKLMENSIDLKALTFTSFSEIVNFMKSSKDPVIGPNTSIVLLTNFGIVQGTQMEFNATEDDSVNAVMNVIISNTFDLRNKHISKLENQNEQLKIINDCRSIVLKDVTITTYVNPDSKINLGQLILFSDQIVGMSFGEMKQP